MHYALVLIPALLAALSFADALQPPTKPLRPDLKAETLWSRLFAIITDLDTQAVVAFSLIGFLLAFNLILRFPDAGALIEQYNQF
jgi:hypothetical protein